MRLSDILGHMDLALFPKIALVIFLVVFLGVLVKIALTPREEMERHRHMALEDEGPQDGVRTDA